MSSEEKFVHKFMRWTDKLRVIFGPADRSYDDGYTPATKDNHPEVTVPPSESDPVAPDPVVPDTIDKHGSGRHILRNDEG